MPFYYLNFTLSVVWIGGKAMSFYNPFHADTTNLSDTEFEKYIADVVKLISNKEGIECEVKHNHIAKIDDGNYQIDVIVKHTFLGSDNITLIEFKKYKNPVPREKVEILYSRINSIGAHKGMLFSSSRFQEGAITFAKKHGIALVQVIDGKLQYEVRSMEGNHIKIEYSYAAEPQFRCDVSHLSGTTEPLPIV